MALDIDPSTGSSSTGGVSSDGSDEDNLFGSSPDGDDDNIFDVGNSEPDSGAGFTSPDEVSGEGGYDGDAGGGVNEPEPSSPDPSPDDDSSAGAPTDGVSGNMGNRDGTTEDNRLAAYLSMMAGGDGGGQTGFGTTADEVLDTVASSPDRFQEAVAGDSGGNQQPENGGGSSSGSGLLAGVGTRTVLAAGAAAVGLAAVLAGGN